MDLTKRQQEIFDYIKRYSAEHGYPPTVRDIGKAVGLASSSTVHAHLANLEKLGLLRRDPSKPRAIELLDGLVALCTPNADEAAAMTGRAVTSVGDAIAVEALGAVAFKGKAGPVEVFAHRIDNLSVTSLTFGPPSKVFAINHCP